MQLHILRLHNELNKKGRRLLKNRTISLSGEDGREPFITFIGVLFSFFGGSNCDKSMRSTDIHSSRRLLTNAQQQVPQSLTHVFKHTRQNSQCKMGSYINQPSNNINYLHISCIKNKNTRDVMELAKIRIRRMRILYEKYVRGGFVTRSKFVSASYYSYCDST